MLNCDQICGNLSFREPHFSWWIAINHCVQVPSLRQLGWLLNFGDTWKNLNPTLQMFLLSFYVTISEEICTVTFRSLRLATMPSEAWNSYRRAKSYPRYSTLDVTFPRQGLTADFDKYIVVAKSNYRSISIWTNDFSNTWPPPAIKGSVQTCLEIESMCSLKRSLQTGGSCSKELGRIEETETNDWPSEQYAQPLLESMTYVARRQRIVAPARSTTSAAYISQ